jgi:hypothetical protein
MVGVFVVAVLRRTIAVPGTTVTRAIVDPILIAILLRCIRSVTAVASIAATAPAATTTIIPISVAIAVTVPTAVVVAAVLLEAALVS